MRTIGIIAEYNPFHSGHRHHIAGVRAAFGPDCAVAAVMSGNWVQRGDAAIADKWTRAALALEEGADLVLELPTLWAAASAETFARGGVALLEAMGCVDALSFGSEAGDLASLQAAANCLSSPEWREELQKSLDRGLSFPAARQAAEILKGLKMPSRLTENAELLIRWSAPEYASMPPAERLMRMGPEGAKQGILLAVGISAMIGALLTTISAYLSRYSRPILPSSRSGSSNSFSETRVAKRMFLKINCSGCNSVLRI